MKSTSKIKFKAGFSPKFIKNTLLVLGLISLIIVLKISLLSLNSPKKINFLLIIPFILFITPYLFLELYDLKKVETKMQVVPRFLRDIVDNVESGMDLISAIKATKNNEYSSLNEDVDKLINQLSWGIDFDKAIMNFAERIGDKSLKRDFLLVIEARFVGGHVEKIFRELSKKIELELLRKKERRNNLASNTFTGYISFVIFIFIIILVYKNLFLSLITTGTPAGTTNTVQTIINNDTNMASINLSLLILMSYELAILSGFLFGLMQENNIISGAPHVVILVVIVFFSFFFFV